MLLCGYQSLMVAWKPDSKTNITSFSMWNSEIHNYFFDFVMWCLVICGYEVSLLSLQVHFFHLANNLGPYTFYFNIFVLLCWFLMLSNISVHQHKIQIQLLSRLTHDSKLSSNHFRFSVFTKKCKMK
jgi:hypothetical protein